jgi:hypothetical protein
MEPNLIRNETLIEDGHARRDEDAILDDVNYLVRLKEAFLTALDDAAAKVSKEAAEDNYIGAEEAFDEMVFAEWRKLAGELGYEPDYPMSPRMKAWKLQSRFRPQPTRGSAPTNPDTLKATGKL